MAAFNTDAMLAPPPDPTAAAMFRKEFYIFSIAFGLNHATVTTPILYASSILTAEIGNASNALLYGATLVCSLFFSNLLYAVLGPKKGLTISMVLYTIYVALFALSCNQCSVKSKEGKCMEAAPLQFPLVGVGALLGGFGAGLLWTCQGAFYAMICEKMAIAEARPKAELTSELAGVFALIFLGFECAVRACTTLLAGKQYLGLSYQTTFFIWAAAAFSATAFFATFASNLQSSTPAARGSIFDKLLVTVRLWRDPKLWLLQTTNITFGFAVGWMGAYVAPNVITPTLDSSFIGFAGAILSGLAAILSRVFGPIAVCIGKGPILALGCGAFLCIAFLSKLAVNFDSGKEAYAASSWGGFVVIFYVFMGIGRAVYESTNKAIIADFFPGEKSPSAFANVFVFGTAASCVAFVLGAAKTTGPFYYLLIVFAAATLPCYVLAKVLMKSEEARSVAVS